VAGRPTGDGAQLMRTARPPAATVLITGASSGIGEAVAVKAADHASRLALLARNEAALEKVADRCRERGPREVRVIVADVGSAADVEAGIGPLLADWGSFDLVVNSAGVTGFGLVTEMPSEVFDQIVRTNLLGSANLLRAVLPRMRARDQGTVVLVGSINGHLVAPGLGAYTVSKWGLRALARTAQIENRDRPGINVCHLSLASVDTPIWSRAASYGTRTLKPPRPKLSVEAAADAVLQAASQPRRVVHEGRGNRGLVLGFSLLPGAYDRLVTPVFRLVASQPRHTTDGHPGNVFEPWDPPDHR
jgi:NADP-dependent 3-hydroxy acid dehydrogenase YdfG